jgi:hypothetical protein
MPGCVEAPRLAAETNAGDGLTIRNLRTEGIKGSKASGPRARRLELCRLNRLQD